MNLTCGQLDDSIPLSVAEHVKLWQLDVRRDGHGFLAAQPEIDDFTHGEPDWKKSIYALQFASLVL